jgi:lipopolysaccharide transport system ATP-binding protein
MSVAIKIENVSKLYRLGTVGTGTISHDLNRWWHQIRGKEDPYAKVGQVNDRTKKSGKSSVASPQSSANAVLGDSAIPANCQLPTDDSQRPSKFGEAEYVWALRDINLEVQQGEILGIIGRNGAGKSTLLKLLSRVTAPTTGNIKTKGRIASLLEVGTGFHPEMTGRENIYLNGAILGMRRHEITQRLDEIVEFSGCEKYLDTPVKRYSSGMTVRLGFAVAAHLNPEILIVDEVLAVGDAEFQSKCINRMSKVSSEGRTVLIVSHQLQTVRKLATKSLLLENGTIRCLGQTSRIIEDYINSSANRSCTYHNPTVSSGLTSVELTMSHGNFHEHGAPLQIRFAFKLPRTSNDLGFSFQLMDQENSPVAHFWLLNDDNPLRKQTENPIICCHIPRTRLYMGTYSLTTYLTSPRSNSVIEQLNNICSFDLLMGKHSRPFYEWAPGSASYLDDFHWEWHGQTSESKETSTWPNGQQKV